MKLISSVQVSDSDHCLFSVQQRHVSVHPGGHQVSPPEAGGGPHDLPQQGTVLRHNAQRDGRQQMLPTPHQQSQGTGRVSPVNQRGPRNAVATSGPCGKGVEKKILK